MKWQAGIKMQPFAFLVALKKTAGVGIGIGFFGVR
jgi:hypothetical protein